jgi:hypothetical protein
MGLAQELKDRILEYLANPFIGAVVVPFGTLVLGLLAELATITHRSWNREDAAVGFDLLLAGVGSELAFMASPNRLIHPVAHMQVDINDALVVWRVGIDLEFGMLATIMWLIVGSLVWIRMRGTTASGGLTWSGVITPILWGLAALGFVYWVNARLLGAS